MLSQANDNNMIADALMNVLMKYNLHTDNVLYTYIQCFVDQCEDDMDEFVEYVRLMVPTEVDLDTLVSDLLLVITFKAKPEKPVIPTLNCKPAPIPKITCYGEVVHTDIPCNHVDPIIKSQIVEQYSLIREPRCSGKAPVLSKIEYLQATDKKRCKRYRDNCLVTEKNEKYV